MNKALNYLKVFVYLLITFSACNECVANELIRTTVGNPISNHSIIRHCGGDTTVVCCNSNQPYFMLLDESSNISYPLFLPINKVWDFEIDNDTVYFCGNTILSGIDIGVIGHFDVTLLASPSMVNVNYIYLDKMKNISALEVGHFAGQKHVVVIGDDIDPAHRTNRILDLIEFPTFWAVYSDGADGYKEHFSDLAITENYVVATSILPDNNGRVWYYNKPSTPLAATIFNGNADYSDMTYPIKGKYLVRHRQDDEFVTACTNDTINDWHAVEYCLSYYNGLTYINSMFFWVPYPLQYPSLMDITIGQCHLPHIGNTVDVLLSGPFYDPYGLTNKSVIFEFPYGVWGYSSSDGHAHNGVILTSLNAAEGLHIVSSGHYISDSRPVFGKSKNNDFPESCWDRVGVDMTYKELEINIHNKELDPRAYTQTPQIIGTVLKRQDTKVVCSYISREEEDDAEEGMGNAGE